MFFNTALDQQLDKFSADNGREPTEEEAEKIRCLTLARGMYIGDFAPNLPFFFSYGMDPEYAVLARIALLF